MGTRFEAWHQCFVQTIMSRGFLSGSDMFRAVKQICERFNEHQRFPSIDINDRDDLINTVADFVDLANTKLEPIQMHIVRRFDEVKDVPYKSSYNGVNTVKNNYGQVYVLCHMYANDDLAKLQKQYTEPELEWLKLVADLIVLETPDHMARENEVVNCYLKGGQNAARKKLSASDAIKVMGRWIDDGYLCKIPYGKTERKTGYRIIIGTRFLIEMEPWMLERYKEDINKCGKCSKVVLIHVPCSNCEEVYHYNCAEMKKTCKKCKAQLKIDGVASKRK